MNLVEELLGLATDLEREGIGDALCGGIAVAVHGHPRFTKDIDLLVQRADLERIRAISRQRAQWRGQEPWVVSREGLLRIKRLSARRQDLADIEALERASNGGRDA